MKLKILKPYTVPAKPATDTQAEVTAVEYAMNDIVTVEDQAACDALINDGYCVEYTDAMDQADMEAEVAVKKALIKAKSSELKTIQKTISASKINEAQETNKMEKMICKTLSDFMVSKTAPAATDFAGVEAMEVLGLAEQPGSIQALCDRRPISGNAIVPVANINDASAPMDVSLATAKTANTTAFTIDPVSRIPADFRASVDIENSLIQDMPSVLNACSKAFQFQVGPRIDWNILNSAGADSKGFKGVINDTNAGKYEFTALGTPTLDDVNAIEASLFTGCKANAVWVINPAYWGVLFAALNTEANINGMIITNGKNKTLLQYPVIVAHAATAANPIFFGDFGRYFVGVRKDLEMGNSDQEKYSADVTVSKVVTRLAGGLAFGKQKIGDETYYAIAYGAQHVGA